MIYKGNMQIALKHLTLNPLKMKEIRAKTINSTPKSIKLPRVTSLKKGLKYT